MHGDEDRGGFEAGGHLRGDEGHHRTAASRARGEDAGARAPPAGTHRLPELARHGPDGGQPIGGHCLASARTAGERREGAVEHGWQGTVEEEGSEGMRGGAGGEQGARGRGGGGARGAHAEGERAGQEEHRVVDSGRGRTCIHAIHHRPLARRIRHPQGLQKERRARQLRRHGTPRRPGLRRRTVRRRRIHRLRHARSHRGPDHGRDAKVPRVPPQA
mmetsp:Transcript_1464/g.3725  ORF Transcript_1464/g.3725 Transcript_1464/m.3725 type:complete len:217 (+) Transcript_1464:1432-2082(+)